MTKKDTSARPGAAGPLLSIGAVEHDTGLSKDILRMWERRYRFPRPQRDANGERAYPLDQVEKLQLIKRLMERGHRPGQIISLDTQALTALGARPSRAPPVQREVGMFLDLVRGHQLADLRSQFTQALMKQGLDRFVRETIAPLNYAVGDAWMRGELAVFEEHFYTEQVEAVLHSAVAAIQPRSHPPRVLLTTFPSEQHTLGLLMVEALLSLEGVDCVQLGAQTPLPEIGRAAAAHKADVVAVSFSAAFHERRAVVGLSELRAVLPAKIRIWCGGASVARPRAPIEGVDFLGGLDSVADQVKQWRAQAGGA
jgi:methanogenic corrinoid protein MtbC1